MFQLYPSCKKTNSKTVLKMSLFSLTSDIFIKSILERISVDYNINYKDLTAKYSFETIALSKMKKSDLVRECKNLGLDSDGSVVQLKDLIKKSRADAGIKAVRGSKKKKAAKKVAPVHNHPLCLEIQKNCPLCQSHGNVFHLTTVVEYEEVTT